MPSRCLRFHLFVFMFAARNFLHRRVISLFSACRYCRLKNIKRITEGADRGVGVSPPPPPYLPLPPPCLPPPFLERRARSARKIFLSPLPIFSPLPPPTPSSPSSHPLLPPPPAPSSPPSLLPCPPPHNRLENILNVHFLYRNTEQTDLNAFSCKITIQQAILTGRYPIVS